MVGSEVRSRARCVSIGYIDIRIGKWKDGVKGGNRGLS
jgi:hypothetical protein